MLCCLIFVRCSPNRRAQGVNNAELTGTMHSSLGMTTEMELPHSIAAVGDSLLMVPEI